MRMRERHTWKRPPFSTSGSTAYPAGRRAAVLALALLSFACTNMTAEGQAKPSSIFAHGRGLATPALVAPTASKQCLTRHGVELTPVLSFHSSPKPVARLGFGTKSGASGYLLFFRSEAQALRAESQWVGEQEEALCIPLGHTMSWCLQHVHVPGIRQTHENTLIDWLSGLKDTVGRRLVVDCLSAPHP
jgi:hypothetical protein